jgi:phage tail-like protein
MAYYGQSKYGTFLYGSTTLADLIAQDFEVRRAFEGPQIVITWEDPIKVHLLDKVRLVRKEFDYPQDINDGVMLYEGLAQKYYSDKDLKENTYYYYTLFSHRVADDTWYFAAEVQGFSVALDTLQFLQRLWYWVPDVHRDLDRKDGVLFALQELQRIVEPFLGETFHLNEDGKIDRGQLQRFLRLLEIELGTAKGFTDNLETCIDVDRAPENLLPYLAGITGADINWDIPLPRRRLEIRYAISVYRTKGTAPGIERQVWTVTGYHALVDPWYDNLLFTNDPNTTTAPLADDVVAWKLYESYGDPIARVIDPNGMFFFKNFGIFARMDPRAILTQAQVDKINRILGDFIPALSRADLFFLDPLNEEEWNLLDFDEGVGVKDFVVNWLFTNQATNTTNSLHYVAAQYP